MMNSRESEKTIERKVCLYAKEKGLTPFKFSSPHNNGVPDRFFLGKNKTIFFIEFKSKGKKPTKLQLHYKKMIEDFGFLVYVIDDIEKGKKVIEDQANV